MATPIDDDTLQRFYDGDLSALEAHGVQARLESDPSAQRRLAELGQLTELLRTGAHELSSQVDSDALFAGIEAKLGASEQLGMGTRLRLIAAEWVEHRKGALIPLVTAGAVAAATLLLVLRPSEYGGPERSPQMVDTTSERAPDGPLAAGSGQAETHAASPAEPRAGAPTIHGSRVENVDFGGSTGTVFEIEDEGVAVAVVWITEDEEEMP
jgi:hypothetical protein